MTRDQAIGIALILAAAAVTIIVLYLLFFTPYDIMTLKIVTTIAITMLAGIVGWIGYTLATTPPPKPIEEIEKEIEEELKKLEQEVKKEEQKTKP